VAPCVFPHPLGRFSDRFYLAASMLFSLALGPSSIYVHFSPLPFFFLSSILPGRSTRGYGDVARTAVTPQAPSGLHFPLPVYNPSSSSQYVLDPLNSNYLPLSLSSYNDTSSFNSMSSFSRSPPAFFYFYFLTLLVPLCCVCNGWCIFVVRCSCPFCVDMAMPSPRIYFVVLFFDLPPLFLAFPASVSKRLPT